MKFSRLKTGVFLTLLSSFLLVSIWGIVQGKLLLSDSEMALLIGGCGTCGNCTVTNCPGGSCGCTGEIECSCDGSGCADAAVCDYHCPTASSYPCNGTTACTCGCQESGNCGGSCGTGLHNCNDEACNAIL